MTKRTNRNRTICFLLIAAGSYLVAGATSKLEIEASDFNEVEQSFTMVEEAASGALEFSPLPGADGVAGRVDVTVPRNSGQMIYITKPLEEPAFPLKISFKFLAAPLSDSAPLRVATGVSHDMVNFLGNIRVQARLVGQDDGTFTLEVRSPVKGSEETSGLKLQDDHWYQLEAVIEPLPSREAFEVQATLTDLGKDPSAEPQVVGTARGIRKDPSLFSGAKLMPLHVGFFAQHEKDVGGAAALDQFTLEGPVSTE